MSEYRYHCSYCRLSFSCDENHSVINCPDCDSKIFDGVWTEKKSAGLIPCKICGGKAREYLTGIRCEQCGTGILQGEKTKKQLVEAWNNWDIETY